MEASKVEITPVHDVEGTGLDDEGIQQIDVVTLSLGDLDDGWEDPASPAGCEVQLTPLRLRKWAQGNKLHRSMVVESKA